MPRRHGIPHFALGEIESGDSVVISQLSFLCTGTLDHCQREFPFRAGATVRRGTVIDARRSAASDMPVEMSDVGCPCMPVKRRKTGYPGHGSVESNVC